MFKLFSVSVLFGVLVGLTITSLAWWWCVIPAGLLIASYFAQRHSIRVILIGFSFGFFLVFINLWHYAQWQLPLHLQKKPMVIQAKIVSVPVYENHKLSFIVQTSQFNHRAVTTNIKLAWYIYHQKIPDVNPGETWQFVVKLTRPHSFKNPGGFDYFLWLLQAHIHATGYIVIGKKVAAATFGINKLRQAIKFKLLHILHGQAMGNFIIALVVGVRQNINSSQWQIMQNTGTNHLIAIAGLHIGLITGLILFFTGFVWKRIPYMPLLIATPRVASFIALLCAWCYAALAGFTLPTQRAVIMLTVFLGCVVLKMPIKAWSGWCLALLIVLIINPLSVLSVGFWLSFSAVAIIILLITGRVANQKKWWRLGKIQFGLALGLLPLTLFFFGNASLVAPIANLIVIPIVGFITVPLSLLGSLLALFSHAIATFILHYALLSMQLAWQVLSYFSHLPFANYQISLHWFAMLSVCLGIVMLFLPRGIPSKPLGVVFMLPLFFPVHYYPKPGSLWLTVLDVGQGLSVVVQTQHHVLIYDTGARFGHDDMGKMVIVPYLQYFGVNKIDKVIISHDDNDHIGGLKSLLAMYPTKNILTSVPKSIQQSVLCKAGQHWQWDGVEFNLLSPDNDHLGLGNDSSCVLQITQGKHRLLLTGDIQKLTEYQLVKKNGATLQSDVLLAPHHGSKTSSTGLFLQAVKPTYVVFSTGYLNRFHFPNKSVVSRYRNSDVKMFNTANSGAVKFAVSNKISVDQFVDSMKLKWLRHSA